jgi:hypothetical protein
MPTNGAILNFDLCDLENKIKKPGYYVILTYDKNLIQPLLQEL